MTSRKNWTLGTAELRDVTFHTCPADQGQIVEVSYGLWADGSGSGLVIRCTHDRSARETSYEAAEAGEEFAPQNGTVETVGDYLPLVIR